MATGSFSSWLYTSLQHRFKAHPLESQACFPTLNAVLAFVACLTHELGQMRCARCPLFPCPGICTAKRIEHERCRTLWLIPPSLPDRQVPEDAGGTPKGDQQGHPLSGQLIDALLC